MTDRSRSWAGCLAPFALAAALAGCVAQAPDPIIEKPAAEAAAEATAPEQAGEPEIASAPAERPEPPEPAIDVPPPEKLLGMGRAEIVKILGQPSFRRHDAPALLMRYRDARCILDLFLYPPAGANETKDPAVEHVEARAADGGRIATGACIESVMKSRLAKARGQS